MKERLSQKSAFVGLDVGTTKICAVVGRENRGRLEILAVGVAPSSGLRKGVVVDMTQTVDSIKKAVKAASVKAKLPVRSAYVGIAGGHIKGFTGEGAIAVKGKTVSLDDVERLVDSAGAVYVPVEREVLHVIPSEFILDGVAGVKDPVGMSGSRLEAKVHIVTGSVASVQNLVVCCERAGVDVLDIILEPLASADAVLTEAEKKKGAVLIDIGGGTTDIAIYRGGLLRHTAVLSVGGNHLTNDIAIGLGVSAEHAEEIKKSHGYAMESMVDPAEKLPPVAGEQTKERKKKEVPVSFLSEIIAVRCEEFLGLVRDEVRGHAVNMPHAVVVLTGGTSLLKGLKELAEEILGVPVRIGIPRGTVETGLVSSPVYATGVGLAFCGLRDAGDVLPDLGQVKILERMKKWVSGFLKK